MGVLLEIKAGPFEGKKISLTTGQTVTIGRSATRSDFALPHDTFMSGLHFAVECGAQGCRVVDRKSSNGTFLNGAKIQDAVLANGDEIKGGQTIFTVKMVADAKLAAMQPGPNAPSQREAAPSPRIPDAPAVERSKVRPPVAEPPALFDSPRVAQRSAAEPFAPPLAMRPAEPSRDPLDSVLSPAAPSRPAADRARPKAAPSQPPAKRDSPVAEPPAQRASPAERVAPPAEQRADSAPPRPEEPPRLRAIPKPPVTPPRPAVAAPNPEVASPPPPAAQRPVERPAERGVPRSAGGSQEAAFSVMGWSFPAAPPEWLVQEGFGLQQTGHEEFPSSVAATEETLGGITLPQFVESQISMLRGYLRDARIEPTMPPRVGGADESMAVDVRHSTKDGRQLVYRRIYARSGSSVGVLTVTTLADELPQVLQSLQPLLDGAAFRATVNG